MTKKLGAKKMSENTKTKTLTDILRMLPEGNIFGSSDSDEFVLDYADKRLGIFKRFEYDSLPFTILGSSDKFYELLKRAERKGTSFKDELSIDDGAKEIVSSVYSRMSSSPNFSKQALDHVLSRVYIDDNILSKLPSKNDFESEVSKVVFGWKHLADFYCVEGLVGGQGENNPFVEDDKSSLIAGFLDSLETALPQIKEKVDDKAWKKISLKLSSIIGRDYKQIDHAADVLKHVFGLNGGISDDALNKSVSSLNELMRSSFETNTDHGKLYNTLIRFHNWLPQKLKSNGLSGDTYDSLCVPTNNALSMLDSFSEVSKSLAKISDATSPKGLALATLVDEGEVGDKSKLFSKLNDLELELSHINRDRREFFEFTLSDSAFYTSLTGGKWKGIKLLHDAKEALGLNYEVPKGYAVASTNLECLFKNNGIEAILNEDVFSLGDDRRAKINNILDNTNFEGLLSRENLGLLGDSVIIRSSMYGEDGASNFSGTYESAACTKENINDAIRVVVKSYFSEEAIASREDLGLAHIPGISYIVQEKIEGRGGVIHLMNGSYGVSFADTPEDAVQGNGNYKSGRTIEAAVKNSELKKIIPDLKELHSTFGDSDIEFVIDKDENIYLTQLRPKYEVPELINRDISAERINIEAIDDLSNTKLDKKYVVNLSFLGTSNIMNREKDIMSFIRKNKDYIVAISGSMPSVAHIPNKIEGHFKIPYIFRGEE